MSNPKFINIIILKKIDPNPTPFQLVRDHVEHLKKLDESGKYILGGPFTDWEGGIVIVKAISPEEAKQIAESDPFVKSCSRTYEIRTLEIADKENNYLL
jgi:uncharacterized protein YciI